MKKGSLNFLGRKKSSLFDSKIKINQDIDNVELVLDSSAIPESGTAKVRSRPTVKHFAPSSDVVQGFAVPTPKVPDLPLFGGSKIDAAVNGDRLSNGSALSVPDLVEGEIFIPPPPSMAPPPPPSFIPPPPNFLGDLDSDDIASLQPPSMPPPKPPSLAPSEEEDLSFLKPPPMAPPKPPSTSSQASSSSLPISTPPSPFIPDMLECPKFTPPPPLQKTHKNPPLKPTRLSSIPSLDGPPQTPAPTPPVQTSTPSSFNPQNTAKLYSVSKTSILGEKVNREQRPKQILLLEDSETADSVAIPVQVNGNTPSVVPPSKPARRNSCGKQLEKDLQDLKDKLHAILPAPQAQLQTNTVIKTQETTIATQQEVNKPAQKDSPKLQRASPVPSDAPVANPVRLDTSPSQGLKYSPLVDRKLRQLKGSEATAVKEGPAASPLALLMAAKQRDKHKSSLSRENSAKRSEPQPTASIHPSETDPNSFTVIPRSTSFSSASSLDRPPQRPQSMDVSTPTLRMHTPEPPRAVENLPVNPVLITSRSSSSSSLDVEKQSTERLPSPSDSVRDEENGEEQCMLLLPPPPEFANFDDEVVVPPPSLPAPDPPFKESLPPTTTSTVSPVNAHLPPPPPPAKPKPPSPPSPPKLPLPTTIGVKPTPAFQTKVTPPTTQPPAGSLTTSQATLLSILQKKMLEMDQKMTVPVKETEAISDEWGSPLSEEGTKIPMSPIATSVPKVIQKPKSSTLPVQTKGLDMHELENKVAKKAQDASSKVTTSTGPHSKQPYGMTFTVRPGTQQPITLVSKGHSS